MSDTIIVIKEPAYTVSVSAVGVQGIQGLPGTGLVAPVLSVNGLTGNVIIDKTGVGLGNVDNTSDINKPLSTATITGLNARVPYTGANANVNLDGYNLLTNGVQLSDSPTVSNTNGFTYWDNTNKTLATVLNAAGGVTLQHGQENHVRVVNKTGALIHDGTAVYVNDAQGNRPTIQLAQANALPTCSILGVTTEDIAPDAEGMVTVFGIVNGFNTQGLIDGQKLYLSPTNAGQLTTTIPTSPNCVVFVGVALNSTTNGSIFINPDQPLAADSALSANTDEIAPTQKAVKAYAAPIVHSHSNATTGTAGFMSAMDKARLDQIAQIVLGL